MSVIVTQESVKLMMTSKDYVTRKETCEFTYKCTIKNSRQMTAGDTIITPTFSTHYSNFDDEWVLRVSPVWSTTTHDLSQVTINLILQSFNCDNFFQLHTDWKISVDGNEKTENNFTSDRFQDRRTSSQDKMCYVLKSTDWTYPLFRYMQTDELNICCTITIMAKKRDNIFNKMPKINVKPQLNEDLKKLLLHEESADVSIKVGHKSFRAIKGILGARNVFEEFLRYIYTDKSPNVDKMPMELLAVAEKYQVDRLKNICEEEICKTIDFDSVASILICSDTYRLKKLNKMCLKFMRQNLQAILSNEIFKIYKDKYPKLFYGVLEGLLLS
ncbi:protein roadkill-like [Aphidius gifuensis]|uniref:protein roadkill-like n=1 Tax=Aphidius gifuensis TaxID=684658 RepID=UPI001CDCC6E2|nr:protein roadkill-like [Aphidius gifuensis]